MPTLIISEKNKAAQAIAEGLGPIQKINHIKGVPIYYVPSRDIYVLPLRGHIQQYENSEPFKKWGDRDPREIITEPAAIEKKPMDYAGPFIKALREYAQKCNLCVIGTDADVEGCNIGMMDALPFVRQANPQIQVMQLWLSDLQKRAVQQAYAQLISPKWSWGESGEARAIVDAIIGFAATREVSLTLSPILKKINVKFTSIGRVQTCLLYLLYLRENLIRNFKPTPFWTITAKVQADQTELTADHLSNNFQQKSIAENIFQRIQNIQIAQIKDIQNTTSSIPIPLPLNTNRALVLITQKVGLSAEQALKTMEDLYLNKILSYPRTDSDVYPDGYDHLSVLQQFVTHPDYDTFTRNLLVNKRIYPKQGHTNAGDHPPISPLQSLPLNSPKFENQSQREVYDLLSRYYLALFGEPGEEAESKILLDIGGEPFMAKNIVILKPGFLAIAPFLSKVYGQQLSLNSSQKTLPVNKILFDEKETQPPPRYTDTTLLKLMEQKNIGTKSTRPNIIQILIDRQYIERKQKSIYVRELGFLLIQNLQDIWQPFLDPGFTQLVEQQLENIRTGQRTRTEVVDELRKIFLDLFDKFRAKKANFIQNMDMIQQSGNILRGKGNKEIASSSQKKESVTTAMCPKCKAHPMKLVRTPQKKQFLVCTDQTCKTFLSLPQKGTPFLQKSTCSLCGFNIIKMMTRKEKHKIEYFICPVCWTKGLSNQTGEGFCSNCKSFKIEKNKCIKRSG
jgi:DNA topoisomerase-1